MNAAVIRTRPRSAERRMNFAWRALFSAVIISGGVKGAAPVGVGRDIEQVNGPWNLVKDGMCYDRQSGGVTVLSCQAGEKLQSQMQNVISAVADLFNALSGLPFTDDRLSDDIRSLRDSFHNLSTAVTSLTDDFERVKNFAYSSHVCPVYLKSPGGSGSKRYQNIWGTQSAIPPGLGEILFFAVRGCGGASVLLRAQPLGSTNEDQYEVEIDGTENNGSSIRRSRNKQPAQVNGKGRRLNCGQFRKFYITWHAGTIQVGTVSECRLPDAPFLTYEEDSPFQVAHAYVSSGTGGPLWWAIGENEESTKTTGELNCAAHPALEV